ncbi:MAG: 16S rRNA (uracil(1498)-N(3))-methyltransferase [Bacteroidetes bacterium]|nr:16S rRNA (uracil(1498)-N(3))-methyltransferase [Bacteroidota bacterium]
MQIFLLNHLEGTKGWLDQEETKHCLKVLRHKAGDEIHAIDGKGNMFLCQIEKETAEGLALNILSEHKKWGEKDIIIRLAVSPLRLRDRFEWILEKAVELGVDEIFPVNCHRTDKYKSKFKVDRAEKIIVTATKQCMRSVIPVLHPAQDFSQFIQSKQDGGLFLASASAPQSLQSYSLDNYQSVTLLIGPEGDFTNQEMEDALKAGYQLAGLGNNRLRTETAAVYGLGVFKMMYGY